MIRAKSLKEPADRADGLRVLIALFRPRGVRSGEEPWHHWEKRLAPSPGLFDLVKGRERTPGRKVSKEGPAIPWAEYERRFLEEMRGAEARAAIDEVARWSREGKTVTLLCHCEDGARCHRSLVKALVEEAEGRLSAAKPPPPA